MIDHIRAIESVLEQFKVDASIAEIVTGSSIVRYELTLGPGVKVQKVAALAKQFAYQAAVESVRVLAPIPGKTAVGIELPRPDRETVRLADVPTLDNHPLTVPVGKDVDGNTVSMNIGKMPHLLIAGATGAGKSSFINAVLVKLLEASPDDVRLVLVDPKRVELSQYRGVAHLLRPVATETPDAVEALNDLVDEMEARYQAMEAAKVRHIDQLDGYPYIVAIIDELSDLMIQARDDVEPALVRLAQKGRAAGVHVIAATQRPSVDVVTGLIKSNFPSRLSFATASAIDARVIMDEMGAEQLLGAGDLLFRPIGARAAIRIQGAYVSDEEISKAVRHATATADVEEMVERLHPDIEGDGTTVLDFLNGVIKDCEQASGRADAFLTRMCDKRSKIFGRKSEKMDLFTKAPEELGYAADTLIRVAAELKALRDEALSNSI